MVGNYELVYEADMKMYRFMKQDTEAYSAWYSSEDAEELKEMTDDDFFATAEAAVKESDSEV
jgi:hypothetical protein